MIKRVHHLRMGTGSVGDAYTEATVGEETAKGALWTVLHLMMGFGNSAGARKGERGINRAPSLLHDH